MLLIGSDACSHTFTKQLLHAHAMTVASLSCIPVDKLTLTCSYETNAMAMDGTTLM